MYLNIFTTNCLHFTEIPVPEHVTVNSVTTSSVSLSWKEPPEIKQIPHSFLVSYETEGTEPLSISSASCSADITSLKPGTEYTVRVYTELHHGRKSQPASVYKRTGKVFLTVLNLHILDGHSIRWLQ